MLSINDRSSPPVHSICSNSSYPNIAAPDFTSSMYDSEVEVVEVTDSISIISAVVDVVVVVSTVRMYKNHVKVNF